MFFYTKTYRLMACMVGGFVEVLCAQPHHTDTLHQNLHPVIITQERSAISEIHTAKQLTTKQIAQTRGESLANALLAINGISALQTGVGVSKPIIGGLHSNRILVLNNGIRQEGQQWGVEHAPEIDPFVAQNISVIKGAGAVRYGYDALGGVVLVQPNDLPTSPKRTGELHLSGVWNGRMGVASATMQQGGLGRRKAQAYRLQGTLRRSGNAHTPQYFLGNTGIAEQNLAAAWGWHQNQTGIEVFFSHFNTQVGIFEGAHIGNLTDLHQVLNGYKKPNPDQTFTYKITRPRQEVQHNLVKIKWHNTKKNNLYTENILAYQRNKRQEYDKHRPRNDSIATLNLAAFDYNLQTVTYDFLIQKQINALQLQAGTNALAQANVCTGVYFIPNFIKISGGVFGILHYDFEQFAAEVGLRYDVYTQQIFRRNADGSIYSPTLNANDWAANTGGVWHINPQWCWRGNVGTSWRPPSANEMYSDGLHHGAAAIETGNPNLTPERAWTMITELNFIQSTRWQTELAIYQNYIKDYIYLLPKNPPVLTIRGAFPAFEYTQTNVIIRGLDAHINYKITQKTTANAQCALINAQDLRNQSPLIFIPTNSFRVGIEQKLNDNARRTQSYMAAQWQYTAKTNVQSTNDYAPPPPAYHLLNAQIGMVFLLNNEKAINITLSAQNILNITYKNYLNRLRYFSDEMGRNISFKCKFQF
jgi:iron complex outermembrane receptor protein